jgi:hypothetical protein
MAPEHRLMPQDHEACRNVSADHTVKDGVSFLLMHEYNAS